MYWRHPAIRNTHCNTSNTFNTVSHTRMLSSTQCNTSAGAGAAVAAPELPGTCGQCGDRWRHCRTSEESDGDPDKLLLFLVIFTQAVLDVHTTLILSGKDVHGQADQQQQQQQQ